MLAVGLDVEMRRIVVVQVTWVFEVGRDVVEMLTQVVGGARHAASYNCRHAGGHSRRRHAAPRDCSRCAGEHSRRRSRVSRRCVVVLLGAQRRAVRVSSLQPHRLLTLLL